MSLTFPALIPEERSYTFGRFNSTRRTDLGGAVLRFLRSRVATSHRLEMRFGLASDSEAKAILDHYRIAQGRFVPFSLAEATLCGTENVTATSWRFAERPQVVDVSSGRWTVSVVLVSVTYELPARAARPIAAGETVAVIAETPPTPPADPFGVFFRGYDPTVRIESDGFLKQTARVFPQIVPTIEVRSGGALGRFPEFDGINPPPSVQIQQPNGGLSLPGGPTGLDLLWDQSLWRTVAILIAPASTIATSGQPTSTIASAIEYDHAGVDPISVQLFVEDLNGPVVSPPDGAPIYYDAPGPSFSHSVAAASRPIVLTFSATRRGDPDTPRQTIVPTAIGSVAGSTSLVDGTSRASTSCPISSIAGAGSIVDRVLRSAAGTPIASIALQRSANPQYVDLSTGSPDEDASFFAGSIVVDGLVAQVLTPASGDADSPRRTTRSTIVPFSLSVGSVVDGTSRATRTTAVSAVAIDARANPLYVDYTSGSPDEDAGFQEISGPSLNVAIPFSFAAGSLADSTSRTSRSGEIPFSLAVGSVVDSPSRASRSGAISFSLSIGSVVDVPSRASRGVSFSFGLAVATPTEPSFVDLTP